MSVFASKDLVPLWDRPKSFLPLHPPPGTHHWSFERVVTELTEVGRNLDKGEVDRRVALLSNPALEPGVAVDGFNAGIQMLLPGESAAVHRHTPAALRLGLANQTCTTTVDGETFELGHLDVVLNPSGTWHGHSSSPSNVTASTDSNVVWLDIVDLPIVSALGSVLFEPSTAAAEGDLLEPFERPATIRFPWTATEQALSSTASIDGVRTVRYNDGEVLPTMAVTAHQLDAGAELHVPQRTCGAIAAIGIGRFAWEGVGSPPTEAKQGDVMAIRPWSTASLRCLDEADGDGGVGGVVFTIDTSPAVRRLGLLRERASQP